MVDTDKIKSSNKRNHLINILLVIMAIYVLVLVIAVIFNIDEVKEAFSAKELIFAAMLLIVVGKFLTSIIFKNKSVEILAHIFYVISMFSIMLWPVIINGADAAADKHDVNIIREYDSRYDIILPNDVIKQNGLSLTDCISMGEALKKSYPEDKIKLLLYDSSYQIDNKLEVNVISNLNDKYTITINLETKEISEEIIKEHVAKTLTEMGTPIYSYAPDEKATFESYLVDSGYSDDAAICSIEERNCCWYIYFTYNGEDRYIKVDKEKNEVTEKGVVTNAERIKE